jgi:aminomethyltransferase
MEDGRKTRLYDIHLKYGGKIIEFAGWLLPVQYEGIIEEHQAVRNQAGLFDVSHMGEVEITGKEAFNYVQNLVTNDISTLYDNQVIYTLMCYEHGGVVDDLLVYRFNSEHYFLVINAGNIAKDYEWMLKQKGSYEIQIKNLSEEISELALQGPKAQQILQKLTETNLEELKFFYCNRNIVIHGINCLVSRTGYTGEDGFEIYVSNEHIEKLWESILEAGKSEGIKPAGLGARDTLRFEAALPLYRHEISESVTPLEAGLAFFVKLNKENFIGKEALLKQKQEGLKRKLIGFEMKERGIPRNGYEVLANGESIGIVTTGYMSPTLKKNVGLALIDSRYAELGTEIQILIRNKALKAEVISKKFYSKNYKK